MHKGVALEKSSSVKCWLCPETKVARITELGKLTKHTHFQVYCIKIFQFYPENLNTTLVHNREANFTTYAKAAISTTIISEGGNVILIEN